MGTMDSPTRPLLVTVAAGTTARAMGAVWLIRRDADAAEFG
jgi:hypothetical protein